MLPNDPSALTIVINHQKNFHRDLAGWRLILNGLMVGLLGALIVLVYDMSQFQTAVRTFPVDAQNRLIQEPPLEKPFFSDNALLTWISEALINASSGNFITFIKMRLEAKKYFTEQGYQEYLDLLEKTDLKNRVEKNKFVVSSSIRSATLRSSGVVVGNYAWNAEIQLDLNFISHTVNTQTIKLNLLVVRVPFVDAEAGIKIQGLQMVVE